MPDPGALPRIVVVGDVIDDIVVVPSDAVRPDTDTPSSIRFRPGGSAANTAAWLGSLGASVDFVGMVGAEDVHRHSELLTRHGVRAHLGGHPELPTGTIVVLVVGEQRSMLTERGANAQLDPDAATDELLAGAAALFLTGHAVSGDTSATALRRLQSRATSLGVPVVLSPGSAGHIADYGVQRFLAVFEGAAVVLASRDESRAMTGLDEPAAAASALLDLAPVVVLTDGGSGITVATSAGITRLPVERVAVVDPTGAGDAFSAGFIHAWFQRGDGDRDPVGAARSAATVAARSLGIVGGRPD